MKWHENLAGLFATASILSMKNQSNGQDFKEFMGMHDADDFLHSPAAKATYIAPNLMPFDQ